MLVHFDHLAAQTEEAQSEAGAGHGAAGGNSRCSLEMLRALEGNVIHHFNFATKQVKKKITAYDFPRRMLVISKQYESAALKCLPSKEQANLVRCRLKMILNIFP